MKTFQPKYLLDTNAVSEVLRPEPSPHLMERWKAHRREIAIASTVWHELLYGWEKLSPSRKKQRIGTFLQDLYRSALPILSYDVSAASWHARERARLEAIGRSLPFRDSQIGAVAQTRHLVLVTANVSDFEALDGLKIENWLLPMPSLKD